MNSPHTDITTGARPETVALFVSDLHLQPAMPHTTAAFLDFVEQRASQAQQLYLLGDIFEAWAGDDDLDDVYNRRIVDALARLRDQGVALYWMAGNRDFLVDERFAQASGAVLLPDPHIACIAGRRIVLTHGDAWCTDDEAYMQFRAQVRTSVWQQQFLALSLPERKKIIESLRAGSQQAQRGKSYEIADVNASAIADLFEKSGTATMIHGHTHRPARHEHLHGSDTRVRYVLSDWDLDHGQPRGDWLAIDSAGEIRRCGLDALTRT
ncbi:MAG TPA: UDP-2,3-diacylglucosamine diphosphatase [Oxalicibacterium sp.]|nr:UDP-2,3-diacylglucosamine diphosphatase [Oxalicibacterium sp.]